MDDDVSFQGFPNDVIVFVYSKDNKIKVLGLDSSKRLHESLISDGWKHIHTLDACAFIENTIEL